MKTQGLEASVSERCFCVTCCLSSAEIAINEKGTLWQASKEMLKLAYSSIGIIDRVERSQEDEGTYNFSAGTQRQSP